MTISANGKRVTITTPTLAACEIAIRVLSGR